jgi:hypothetical protein
MRTGITLFNFDCNDQSALLSGFKLLNVLNFGHTNLIKRIRSFNFNLLISFRVCESCKKSSAFNVTCRVLVMLTHGYKTIYVNFNLNYLIK